MPPSNPGSPAPSGLELRERTVRYVESEGIHPGAPESGWAQLGLRDEAGTDTVLGVQPRGPLPTPGDTVRIYGVGERVYLVARQDGSILHDGAAELEGLLARYATELEITRAAMDRPSGAPSDPFPRRDRVASSEVSPMLITQTVDGSDAFDGTADTGLVQFEGVPTDRNYRIRVVSVAFSSAQGAPAQATDVRLILQPPGGTPPSQCHEILRAAGPIDSFVTECTTLVPRQQDEAGTSWELVFIAEKAQTATLTVDYEVQRLSASA